MYTKRSVGTVMLPISFSETILGVRMKCKYIKAHPFPSLHETMHASQVKLSVEVLVVFIHAVF